MPERRAALTRAHAAHDRKDWALAGREYQAYIDAGGPSTDVAVALGDVLTELGRLTDAERVYAEGARADPDDGVVALRLGRLAQRLGRWEAARAATRAGVMVATPDGEPAVGAGEPLPLLLTAHSMELLAEAAWGDFAIGAPWLDAKGAKPLTLTRIDHAPGLQQVRLVASAQVLNDGLSAAEAIRCAELVKAAVPESSTMVFFYRDTWSDHPELTVLRSSLQNRSLPACFIGHQVDATAFQLHALALRMATRFGSDALCVRSLPLSLIDLPFGLFSQDPMLGFACWVCADQRRTVPAKWLRGIPACSGAVTLVRDRVLQEAGQLDMTYETLDSSLQDLKLRANRMGFSSISIDARSPGARTELTSDAADDRLLQLRYPEHQTKLRQAASNASREVDRLSAALASPRDFALDLSGLRAWHDGTSALGVAVARALSHDRRFDLKLLCSPEAAQHHGLNTLSGVTVADPQSAPMAAACLKIGQPFTWKELLAPWSVAPVAGFYMLDAISLDVERLSVEVDLDELWRLAFGFSELIGHLSQYTQSQMRIRFGDQEASGFVALCSTAVDEYAAAPPLSTPEGVLLVGNAYEHKNLLGAIKAIHSRSPQRRLTVVGRTLEPRFNVTWLDSGGLPHAELRRLYAEAEAVVFPSLYEGFGLPIMDGLAARRPVLAIDQPVFREIKDRSRWGEALHLFPTTSALAAGLDDVCRSGFPAAPTAVREHRWSDAARLIGDAAADAVARFDPKRLARRVGVARLVANRRPDA